MLITPVRNLVKSNNLNFCNTATSAMRIANIPQVQSEKTKKNKKKAILFAGAGLTLLALGILGGIKYFGRNTSKISYGKSLSDSQPTPLHSNPVSENNSVDYISKLKHLFKDSEKSYLVERNLNEENKEIFHYLVDNPKTLDLKSMSDLAFYLRSVNNKNKQFVLNQLVPLLKSKGISSAGEISDVICSTTVGDLNAVNRFIQIKEDCYRCNSFTPLEGDKGFSGIFGLRSTMLELHNKFIVPVQKKFYGENSIIPNGIVLYGPSSCGKTHLAKALAKQSGCRFGELEPGLDIASEIANLRTILEKTSKGSSKKHSICLIDNAEWLLCDEALPKKEVFELFKDCSKKHNCTFVFTLNDKHLIPEEFPELGIENIHVPKPDYNTYHDVLNKAGFEKSDIEEIILELYNKMDTQYPGASYATGQITNMIQGLKLQHMLSKKALIETIQEEIPLLTPAMLQKGEIL